MHLRATAVDGSRFDCGTQLGGQHRFTLDLKSWQFEGFTVEHCGVSQQGSWWSLFLVGLQVGLAIRSYFIIGIPLQQVLTGSGVGTLQGCHFKYGDCHAEALEPNFIAASNTEDRLVKVGHQVRLILDHYAWSAPDASKLTGRLNFMKCFFSGRPLTAALWCFINGRRQSPKARIELR
eukprot:2903229-Amphidinium_carterae.3